MIVWNDSFKVGLPAVDCDHLVLFSLLNQIDINIDSTNRTACLADVLGAVLKYVEFHFTHEEQMMYETLYPKRNEHCDRHRLFTLKINHFHHDVLFATDQINEARKLRQWILDWFQTHILTSDQEFATWLTQDHESLSPMSDTSFPVMAENI